MNCFFDAHCDTVYEASSQNLSLMQNNLQLDIERMEKYDTYIQVFAAFVDKKSIKCTPMQHCLSLIEKYRYEVEKNKISVIQSIEELQKANKDGGVWSILSIEGGEALGGELSAIKKFYDLGVRLITLTWNYSNEIADGITEIRGGGLTEFGKEAVKMMEDMGILIDVSHISEKGFWDVYEITRYPFVASHSCVKALCNHPRNLTDEQIKAIIHKNGCIGVNFYPLFLDVTGKCSYTKIAEHIEYIINLGGENCVGLGSDFDGVENLPYGISGVQDMHKLTDCMYSVGFSEKIINKVLFDNFYRIFFQTFDRVYC